MATIDDGELLLEIQGAEREELEDALIAARRVFAGRGVAPRDALYAYFKTDDPDCSITGIEWEQASLVDQALEAAERAACRERAFEPEWSDLSLTDADGHQVDLMAGDEPHYRMREREPLPELPLGLPPLDPRLVMLP